MYIPLLIFILMLIFPGLTKSGAYTGLMLWFSTIIPTLLPYMIISSAICYTGAFNIISNIIHPITGSLFGISKNANYCLIIGFLCGYPMGSKVIADMLQDNQITYEEAEYLLCFCNNVSPSFMINYVASTILMNCYKIANHTIYIIICIMFVSPIITSFIYRFIHNFKSKKISHINLKIASTPSQNNFLDRCILNSFENIFKIGGYIIIFSIISVWIINNDFIPKNLAFVISSIFEITSGLNAIKHTSFSVNVGIVLVSTLCSFGGICAIAQTYSMISETKLSLIKYIKYKLLNALITFLLVSVQLS